MITTSQAEISEERDFENTEAVILGHCIFNMNTRAPGIAAWPGAILPILRSIRYYYGEIHQYPCIEAAVVGMRRWWHVKEQYDTFTFRSLSKLLSKMYSNYFRRNRIDNVKLLGLGLSPTCGFRYTQSDPTWGGRPKEILPVELIKRGSGVLIEEMIDEFKNAGIELEVLDVSPSLIYPDYESRLPAAREYPATPSEALEEIEAFLHTEISFKPEELSHIKGLKDDLRSKKTIVISRRSFERQFERVLKYSEKGIGISIIEDIYGNNEEMELLSKIYTAMIGNMIVAGHNIQFLVDETRLDSLEYSIIKHLEEFFQKEIFR